MVVECERSALRSHSYGEVSMSGPTDVCRKDTNHFNGNEPQGTRS
jgi:hypothetical protein